MKKGRDWESTCSREGGVDLRSCSGNSSVQGSVTSNRDFTLCHQHRNRQHGTCHSTGEHYEEFERDDTRSATCTHGKLHRSTYAWTHARTRIPILSQLVNLNLKTWQKRLSLNSMAQSSTSSRRRRGLSTPISMGCCGASHRPNVPALYDNTKVQLFGSCSPA